VWYIRAVCDRALNGKIHLRAFAAADPVALLRFDPFNKIYRVQAVQQLLCIFGDAQHPLVFNAPHHFATATFAYAINYFFIGQAAFAAGAPVDGHFSLVCKAMLVQLKENPLRPLVVRGIGGIDLARVVKCKANAL
jgi:hypothetical protein